MASSRPSMRDRVREDANKAASEGASYIRTEGRVPFFSPKAEDYDLDFLPYENDKENHPKGYEVGELIAYRRFRVHSGIGAEDSKYVCPTTIGKKCPICEERIRMAKNKNADADLIKSLNAKERVLFNVIDLGDERKGVQLFDHSFHMFAKKLFGDIDKSENAVAGGKKKKGRAHAGFAELEDGQTLTVSFIEKKIGNGKPFYEADRIDAEDRDPYNDSILDEVVNLDDCLKILSYEELEKIFLELDPEDQGSNRKRESEEDSGRGSRRGGRGNKEEEGEEGGRSSRRGRGNDDEEETGRSSRRGAAKEEDPEPPSRSRGRRGAAEDNTPPEETSGRSSRRGAAKEEDPEPSGRSSRRGAAKEEDPEPSGRSSRRGAAKEEDPEPSGRATRGGRDAAKEDNRCYVPGGVFGKDCDTHLAEAPEPNCYDCPEETWKACNAAKNGN